MIHQTQKRLEELYELLKGIDKRVLRITSNEQTMSSKLDMVIESIDIMRQERGNYRSEKSSKENSDINENNNGKDDDFGGGGVSMSIQDKSMLLRAAETVEELEKNFAEMVKEMKSLKEQMSSINGVLSIVQSELTFKLDKESFEHALDQKLDKEEFYSKAGDPGNSDEALKRIESEIKKATKKNDSLLEELQKKQKRLKKRVEELESNHNLLDEKLKNMLDASNEAQKEKSENPNVGYCY